MPEVTCSLDRAGLRVIDVLLVEDDPGDVPKRSRCPRYTARCTW